MLNKSNLFSGWARSFVGRGKTVVERFLPLSLIVLPENVFQLAGVQNAEQWNAKTSVTNS